MKKIIMCIMVMLMLFTGCGNSSINKALEEANLHITNKEFKKALDCYKIILDKDKENVESDDMVILLENYLDCVNSLESENIDKAMDDLEEVKRVKNNYVIKEDIEKLEKDIKKKEEEKSKLVLEYVVYRSEDEVNGKYYTNGEGKIVLAESDYLDKEPPSKSVGYVSIYVPESSVIFKVKNIGKEPIVNPRINFKFNGMAIEFEQSERWIGIQHNRGIGNWSEVRWQPPNGTTIQNGMPITINFSFIDAMVSKNGAEIEITLSGDNMKAETFKIPVELRKY